MRLKFRTRFLAACAVLLVLTAGLPVAAAAAEPSPVESLESRFDEITRLSSAGSLAQAAGLAEALLVEAEARGDDALSARANALAGHVSSRRGTAEAEPRLLRALELARRTGDAQTAARAGNDLGLLQSQDGRHAAALATFEASAREAEAAGDEPQALRARLNRARTLLDDGDPQAARAAVQAILARLRALPASNTRVALLTTAGRLLGREATGATATDALELLAVAAREAAARDDARAQSYALGYAGELNQALGQRAAALTLARQAVHQAQRAGAPESLYRWQWLIGRLLAQDGDTPAAIAAYRGAVGTLETVRGDLAVSSRANGATDGFRQQAGPVYVELVDLLLREARAAPDPAAREPTLRQARDVMESLKSAELEDYFQDDCVAGLKSKTVGIDTLTTGTAAVYPIVLPDRLAVLVSTTDHIRLYEVAVSAAELTREVAQFRSRLEKRSTYQYLPHARRIHDWLIGPLAADLDAAGVHTLVFVPDGALRTIPLAALFDGSRFLVERYAVGTVPGLTLTDPRAFATGTRRALLSGLTESVDGFAALPAVAGELDDVGRRYPGKTLRDDAFTPRTFAEELMRANYAVVHIASHGQFAENIADTFLLTHAGRLGMNDLESEIGRTATRDQPVELLTLSACQTAAGNERAALGLAGVAVKAGARSALATLWSVNDRASGTLVSAFYAALQESGESKAEALRTAQLALLAEARFRHPAYWSPFLMIGNWL